MATKEHVGISTAELARKIESLKGQEKLDYCLTLSTEEKKSYIKYIRERDIEMVRGKFKCFEPIGGSLTMSARPYEGCEYTYTFESDKEYTIPRCIAQHLETGCWWPTHGYAMDASGQILPTIGKKNHRFSFNTSDIR